MKMSWLLLFVIFLMACVSTQQSSTTETLAKEFPVDAKTNEPSNDLTFNAEGEILVDAITPYIVYNEKDFNYAQEHKKVIFLEFYAAWCPYCRTLDPQIRETFKTLNDSTVVAFRADYDKDVPLKKQYNVVYQHTHIVLAPDGSVVYKALETDWNEQAIIDAIKQAKGG